MNEPCVTVQVHCDRTDKEFSITIPASQYAQWLRTQSYKRRNAEKLDALFATMGSQAPDLVVYFRGKLVVLPTVSERQDRMVSNLLQEVTRSDLFPREIRPRNKNKPK